VLGLEPTADEAQVRLAYSRLARVLHPDAVLDPSLDDLRHLRAEAFVQLGQAYDTLRSPGYRQHAAERAARLRGRPVPPPAPPTTVPAPDPPPASRPATEPRRSAEVAPQVDPEHAVREARRHFEGERYWDAIQLLEPVVAKAEGATRFQARILLAQAYLKNPKWRKRAEEILLELVRERPQDVPAHLLLAEIYRSSGLVTRARAAYQKVLALEPGNGEASKGVAELEPPPPEPAPPSRLRGFFRKG
jgi:curved DNA-binding protein CbpA